MISDCRRKVARIGPDEKHPRNGGFEGVWSVFQTVSSTFDHVDIDRQPALAGFLVFALHINAGLAHGFDHLVE